MIVAALRESYKKEASPQETQEAKPNKIATIQKKKEKGNPKQGKAQHVR